MKLTFPAPERNKLPILEVLQRVLPASGTVLEIASGSGQHAAFFSAKFPSLIWIPSDLADAHLRSIAEYVKESARPNLLPPRCISVTDSDWGVSAVDAIFNANLIHIAPWDCTEGLLRGAARTLRANGVLVIYGPFRIGGVDTSESNAAFDADLKRRDPSWGVRDLEAVTDLAQQHGLWLRERVPMPSNNQTLIFAKKSSSL